MNRKDREAFLVDLDRAGTVDQFGLVVRITAAEAKQAAAEIRRLAEALEQISRATAIDNEAALVARRVLDGEDND